ncbi:MAG: hypothetical protein ABWZ57_03865 [Mesorhizobium sp.]|jgi:hypothetical protein
MKHQTLEQLQTIAEVRSDTAEPVLGRDDRLRRWAELLERDPGRRLATLGGTEYQPVRIRDRMRAEASPLTVAFDDPLLRGQGLADDSYGEAKRFFEMSDWQLHRVVCYCHFGETVRAGAAARLVRAAVEPRTLLGRLRDMLFVDAH